ncbi:MAG: hypothetical protein GY822_10340 [Deltaproteobacteria bacterium]|nr:hypothetical protein [Deltaproteobacteria bacterium]
MKNENRLFLRSPKKIALKESTAPLCRFMRRNGMFLELPIRFDSENRPGLVMTLRSLFILSLLLALAPLGCKPDLLPGTSLEDSEENRSVVEFMNEYKRAVESRSAEGVLKLVAPDYYEDMGTVSQEDDYGLEKLKRDLQTNFDATREIRLDVIVQNVEVHDDAGLLVVDYRYLQRALLGLPAGDKWVTHSDVNQVVLRKKGELLDEGFVIIAGL